LKFLDVSTGEITKSIHTEISIDNLTILGSPSKDALNLLGKNPFVEKQWLSPTAMYHYNYLCIDGAFVQVTHHSASSLQIRLEFNPNRYKTKSGERALMSILRCITDPETSRVDTAIDFYGEDFALYQFHDFKNRKKQVIYSRSGRPETIYLGARSSDEQIRIYDKGVEQKIGHQALWWRVESQVRKEKARAIEYNPFEKVLATKEKEIEDYDISTRAMLEYLRSKPERMAELSKNARTKYKQLIAALGEPFKLDFSTLYEQKKDDLLRQVDSWLSLCNISMIQ
jgi:hypothetical protein